MRTGVVVLALGVVVWHYGALVSTPDQRARDKDRDAAIKTVEAAWADGQIVEADRDKRVAEIGHAQTLGEIQMLVHDLQPPAPTPYSAPIPAPVLLPEEPASPPAPVPAAPTPAPTPYPAVDYGPPAPHPKSHPGSGSTKKVSKGVFLVPLVVVAVVGFGIVAGIVAIVHAISDNVSNGGSVFGGEPVDVLSVEGYDDLLAAVRDETGSTEAFSAVLYPTYAVVELPVDKTTQHEDYWYWDGHDLSSEDVKSSSSYERTDLSTVDGQVVVDLVQKVRRKMSDESTWYAIVRAPDESGAAVWVYASNEYGDSVYLGAKADGTITYDSTKH